MDNSIVSVINNLCKTNSITVGQLEKELKFSQGLISRWDKNSPSVDKIIAVADYFRASVDFILGRTSTDSISTIEEVFIDKIIQETESYLLQWTKYVETYIPSNPLRDHFISTYKWKFGDTIEEESIKFELTYYSSCLYVVEGNYNKKRNYFLIMQLDINSQSYDNFIPISNFNDFEKTNKLVDAISLCMKNYELTNKGRAVIQSYINSSNDPDSDFISRKYIVNNFLANIPGFVLDARAGAYLANELNEVKKQIQDIQNKLR